MGAHRTMWRAELVEPKRGIPVLDPSGFHPSGAIGSRRFSVGLRSHRPSEVRPTSKERVYSHGQEKPRTLREGSEEGLRQVPPSLDGLRRGTDTRSLDPE